MNDAIQSMVRFSWAMSLFGLRQATQIFTAVGTMRTPRSASVGFDAVSEVAREQLDDQFTTAYRNGDRWQQSLIDAVFGIIDPALEGSRSMTSQTVLRGSLTVLRQSAGMLEAAMPVDRRWAWRELRNKLEAFDGFQYVDQILGFRDLDAEGLQECLEEAGGSDPYLRLWLTEGLGFAFAEAAWDADVPQDLLRQEALEKLPSESLIPLHTGMGLSLARRVIPDMCAGDRRLEAALARFSECCDHNARDGYTLAAYEALGLITRQLSPDSVSQVDAVLRRHQSPDHLAAFWHGLGRGLYFVVTQAWPGSAGRAVEKLRQETPGGVARWNAIAGLAWALTLVNLRQPEILEAFVGREDFDADESEAIGHGISSAIVLWVETIGEELILQALRDHQPEGSVGRSWDLRVTQPITAALDSWSEVKTNSGPDAIFHYRRGT